MTRTCTTCDMGLDHCHGIVVEHPDGSYECLEGCGGGLAVHDDLVTCADLALGCCQVVILDDDERAAALAPAA